MAESTQTLTFKLVIDGKEAHATLDFTKGEFVELEQQISKIAGARAPMLQQFAKDLSTVDLASEGAAASILEFIQVNQLTEKEISSVIQQLDAEARTLAVNSAAWKQKMAASMNLKAAMNNLVTQQVGMNNSTQAGIPGVNNMRMAMSQFGYALNDAQVFMVNFRMGLMGISNNIPMIVQNFVDAQRAGKGTTSTMKMITQSIMGGGGLIIGINALMLVINLLPGLFDKSTESIEKQKEEIKKLRDEYAKLTREQLNNYIQTREESLSQLQDKYPEKRAGQFSSGTVVGGLGPGNVSREAYIVSDEARYGKDYDQVKKLEKELSALREVARDLGNIENIRNRILINQEQLLKLNENEASPFYYKNIVKTATSYEDAKKTLDGWIKADEELVKQRESTSKKNPAFEKAIKELEAAQTHQLNMADIEEKGDAVILSMKKEQLLKQIELYEKYKQDVTGLLYELVETEAELQKALKLPAINVEDPEDIILKDVLAKEEYEKSLLNGSLESWYSSEDKKISAYENYSDLKLALDKEYASRKAAIERKSAENTLSVISGTLGQLAGLFAQHTAAYKILAIAQAVMDTYRAANVALASAPPPWNFIAMAGVIGAGLKNVDEIVKVGIDHPVGFEKGGRLPKGKMGFIEGFHDEIIAPEKDFNSAIKSTTADAVKLALMDARNYISINQSSMTDFGEVKGLLTSLKKQLDEGINARAFLDDREAKKLRNKGSAIYRRSKLQ